MKKIFLGIVTLSMLFGAASCTKVTDVDETSTGQIVTFDVGMKSQKQTRSQEIWLDDVKADAEYDDGNALNVHAYDTSGNEEWHEFKLKWDKTNNKWVDTNTNGKPFLQPGEALRYYSVYPDTDSGSGTVTNPVWTISDYGFSYFVQTDVENAQEDLIVASVPATMAHDIKLQFKHLLSQLNFAVQALPGINIDITGITVQNVLDKGDYKFSTGWENLGSTDKKGTYTYTPDPAPIANLQSGAHEDLQYLGNNSNSHYRFLNAMMLMPQDFSDASNGSFTVTFSLTEKSTETVVAKDKTATIYFRDFDVKKWEPGIRYIYVIDFTNYFASGEVEFTATIDSWENPDNTPESAERLMVSLATVAGIQDAITNHGEHKLANTHLVRFPISIPDAITKPITISPTDLNYFAVGDVIILECVDSTSAKNITLSTQTTSNLHWVLEHKNDADTFVTLTRAAAVN